MPEHTTTRPIPADIAMHAAQYIPSWARSVTMLHGEDDHAPKQFTAHKSEISYVRRAVRIARREFEQ